MLVTDRLLFEFGGAFLRFLARVFRLPKLGLKPIDIFAGLLDLRFSFAIVFDKCQDDQRQIGDRSDHDADKYPVHALASLCPCIERGCIVLMHPQQSIISYPDLALPSFLLPSKPKDTLKLF